MKGAPGGHISPLEVWRVPFGECPEILPAILRNGDLDKKKNLYNGNPAVQLERRSLCWDVALYTWHEQERLNR